MTYQEFVEKLKASPRPVVVDFWAPWCGPCRAIEPMLKSLDKEYAGRVDVLRINADDNQEVLRALRIFGIPTLAAFNGGVEVGRMTGVKGLPEMASLFDSAISGVKPVKRVSILNRALQVLSGLALVLLAYQRDFAGGYWLVALIGVVIAFAAVRDRCPIWQTLAPKLEALWKREKRGVRGARLDNNKSKSPAGKRWGFFAL